MSNIDEIRARWCGADWRYREWRLNSGILGSVGIERADGTPIASSPFPEEASVFQLLGNAPHDISILLACIDEMTRNA